LQVLAHSSKALSFRLATTSVVSTFGLRSGQRRVHVPTGYRLSRGSALPSRYAIARTFQGQRTRRAGRRCAPRQPWHDPRRWFSPKCLGVGPPPLRREHREVCLGAGPFQHRPRRNRVARPIEARAWQSTTMPFMARGACAAVTKCRTVDLAVDCTSSCALSRAGFEIGSAVFENGPRMQYYVMPSRVARDLVRVRQFERRGQCRRVRSPNDAIRSRLRPARRVCRPRLRAARADNAAGVTVAPVSIIACACQPRVVQDLAPR